MSSKLYEKHNYLNKNILYLKNTSIIEYDIHSAGTCILYELGLIKEDNFKYLMSLDKFTRNVYIGRLLKKHPKWNKLQMNGFSDVMRRFIELNNIEDNEILSIKKDSITIIGRPIKKLKVDNLYEFHIDGKYNSYMYLKKKEIYIDTKTMGFNTKNFGETVLEVQTEYFINFILSLMILDSKRNNKNLIYSELKNFRSQFLNRELDHDYYYDLDEDGYVYNFNGTILRSMYKSEDKNLYSIDNNYSYLEDLIKLLLIENK